MNKYIILIVLVFFGFLLSCTSDHSDKDFDTDVSDLSYLKDKEKSRIYYQVPSPENLLDFIKMSNLSYKKNLLNPMSNLEKYVSRKSQEINLGIYSADLAYAIAFDEYQTTLKYLNPVKSLSDEIGVGGVIGDVIKKDLIGNMDSLLKVANNTYYGFIRYLEGAERTETLALIIAGGWLESLYIIINSVDKFEDNPKAVELIADQKLTFETLVDYLKKYKSDNNVKELLDEMSKITLAFSKIKKKDGKSKKDSSVSSGKIVVGGSKKFFLKKEQFIELKTEISNLRNKLTQNKNS